MDETAEPLRRAFEELAPLPDTEWRHFRRFVVAGSFGAHEHLVREGQHNSTLHFIVRGLVRMYYLTDGEERTRGFDYEGRFNGGYECAVTGRPSSQNIQALEPTSTLSFPGDILNDLYDRDPCWDRIVRRLYERTMVRREDKEMRFRMYSPEQHYRLLIERRSPLLGRVPLQYVASYLGIRPETMSRIRARVRATGPVG